MLLILLLAHLCSVALAIVLVLVRMLALVLVLTIHNTPAVVITKEKDLSHPSHSVQLFIFSICHSSLRPLLFTSQDV